MWFEYDAKPLWKTCEMYVIFFSKGNYSVVVAAPG